MTNQEIIDKFIHYDAKSGSANNMQILDLGEKTALIGYGRAVYALNDHQTDQITVFGGWQGYSTTTSTHLNMIRHNTPELLLVEDDRQMTVKDLQLS